MIIKGRDKLETYYEDIMDSKNPLAFTINENENLALEDCWESNLFLCYIRGNWYASNLEQKGGSENRKIGPHQFFFIGNKLYLEAKTMEEAELAAPAIPLSDNHVTFLLFCKGMKIGLIVADGSKTSTIMMEEFRATRKMWKLLLISTCAMIRQHDYDAADEIETFWSVREEDPVLDPKKVAKVSIFANEITSYGP